MPNARASAGSRDGDFSSSFGLAQIDSTGEEIASGSPLRSVIIPREVAIGISRTNRASPCCW